MVVSFLREYIGEISTKVQNGDFLGVLSHGNFSGYCHLVNLFHTRFLRGRVLTKSPLNPLRILLREQLRDLIVRIWSVGYLMIISFGRQSSEVDGISNPVNLGVPFLEPWHSEDNLGSRELYYHKFYSVRESSQRE